MGLLFAEVVAHAMASTVMRIKGWLAYRRLYSPAERREHRQQIDAGEMWRANDPRFTPDRSR